MKYTENLIWQIWAKAEIFAGNDPVFWRKDVCGAWIFRGDYKNRDSEYGWVIGRIKPSDKDNDGDNVSNLYPLHWANTSRDLDGNIICKMTSAGVHNNVNSQKHDLQKMQIPTMSEY